MALSLRHICRGRLRQTSFLSLTDNRCYSVSFNQIDKVGGVRKTRVFSGIQPTGVPHLGNYFGAIQHWTTLQQQRDGLIISVVDLHSITMPQEPNVLRENIRDMVACLVACGIDPHKSILFQQSSVTQHAELAWVLGCLTTLPRLQHLPQWKQKSEQLKEVPLGLFIYPVLQAADILLYKATQVPVGDDQAKHLELARDLAKLFNNKYGQIFPVPKPVIGDFKRLRSLRKPEAKMSKSDPDRKSRIELADPPDVIREKLKKAVTDITPTVTFDPVTRPGVSNLIDIYAAFTDLTASEVVEQNLHLDTLGFKMALADVIIEELAPIRKKYLSLRQDPGYLEELLRSNGERASCIAAETYDEVKRLIGLT